MKKSVFIVSLVVLSFKIFGMNPNDFQNNSYRSNNEQFGSNGENFSEFTTEDLRYRSIMSDINSSIIKSLLFDRWLEWQRLTREKVTPDHVLRFAKFQLEQWLETQDPKVRKLSDENKQRMYDKWIQNLEKEYNGWKSRHFQDIESLSENEKWERFNIFKKEFNEGAKELKKYQLPLFKSWLKIQDQRVKQLSEAQKWEMFSNDLRVMSNLPMQKTEQSTQEGGLIAQNFDRKRKYSAEKSKDVQDIIHYKRMRKNDSNVTDKWFDSFETPSNPSREENFFDVAEANDEIGIDKDTAKKIINDWRRLERNIWKSFWEEKKLTENDLKNLQKFWKLYRKKFISKEYIVKLKIDGLLEKIRKGREDICKDYSEYNAAKVKRLIYYHDICVTQRSNLDPKYMIFRYANNQPNVQRDANKWISTVFYSSSKLYNSSNVTDKWFDSFETPSNPSREENFFDVAESNDEIGIDKDTAKKIINDWRRLERNIWKSFWEEKKLTENDLKNLQKFWKLYRNTFISKEYIVKLKIDGLLEKIREGRKDICKNYSEYNAVKVKRLIYYHDIWVTQRSHLDPNYLMFRYAGNQPIVRSEANRWLSTVFYGFSELYNSSNVTDKWFDSFETSINPSREENFFDVAEANDEIGIDKDTAKKIINDWRRLERNIWKSFWEEKKLTENDLKNLQKFGKLYRKTFISKEAIVKLKIGGLLERIKGGRENICKNYSSYNATKVNNLIYYHDMLITRTSNLGLAYRMFRYTNNSPYIWRQVIEWLSTVFYGSSNFLKEIYSEKVVEYIRKTVLRNALFPEIVKDLRNIGLTDKKINYIINFSTLDSNVKNNEVKNFFKTKGFKINIGQYDYVKPQQNTYALLKKQYSDISKYFVNELLGNSPSTVHSSNSNIPLNDEQDVISQITKILNTYEKEKEINLTEAVQKAVNNLVYDIGFQEWKVMELLELTDDGLCPSLSKERELNGFYNKNKEIEDPDKNKELRKRIEKAREKNAVSAYKKGLEIWMIADLFGVTRDEIRGYIRDDEASKEQAIASTSQVGNSTNQEGSSQQEEPEKDLSSNIEEDVMDLTEENIDKKVTRPTKDKGKQPIVEENGDK